LLLGLFNDVFSTAVVASNEVKTVNDEFRKMCKEVVVVYYKALSEYLPGGARENHENRSEDIEHGTSRLGSRSAGNGTMKLSVREALGSDPERENSTLTDLSSVSKFM
jgi:hypothetical protein